MISRNLIIFMRFDYFYENRIWDIIKNLTKCWIFEGKLHLWSVKPQNFPPAAGYRQQNIIKLYLLCEALFTSGSAKLDLSVRTCVTIIIDFCDWDMEGDEGLLSTGSLNYDFGRSEQKLKKSLHLQALATGIWMFRDPDLRRFWSRFGVIFEKRCENVTIRQSAVSGGRMGTDRRVWSGVGGELTQGGLLSKTTLWMTWTGKNVNTHTR